MNSTYSITEAQAKFPAVMREAEGGAVAITRRDRIVGYVVSTERMEGILETLEFLANPAAMECITQAESGQTRYLPLSVLDELEND